MDKTVEQQAREMLADMGVEHWLSSGDLVPLANLIEEVEQLREYFETATALQKCAVEMSRLRAEMEWQPIGTAPRDGTAVLVSDGTVTDVAYWGAPGPSGLNFMWVIREFPDGEYNGWVAFDEPTHWMPLPDPPR